MIFVQCHMLAETIKYYVQGIINYNNLERLKWYPDNVVTLFHCDGNNPRFYFHLVTLERNFEEKIDKWKTNKCITMLPLLLESLMWKTFIMTSSHMVQLSITSLSLAKTFWLLMIMPGNVHHSISIQLYMDFNVWQDKLL